MITQPQPHIQAHQPQQLLDSLQFETLATIRRVEGDFASLVEADFRDSLEGHRRRSQIRICYRWLMMYRGASCQN